MARTSRNLLVLDVVTVLAVLLGLYLALGVAPLPTNLIGDEQIAQRILYFHVGSAWVGFGAFAVTLVASILYLRTGSRRADIVALSSVEIGVAFIAMNIISGSLWARPTWNTYWTWDPRLTTAAILFLVYVAYLMLRGAIEDPARRARFAAVYGIFGFISVPITFESARIWRTIHPVIIGNSSPDAKGTPTMTGPMVAILLYCVAVFTLLFIDFLLHRVQLEEESDAVEAQRQQLESFA